MTTRLFVVQDNAGHPVLQDAQGNSVEEACAFGEPLILFFTGNRGDADGTLQVLFSNALNDSLQWCQWKALGVNAYVRAEKITFALDQRIQPMAFCAVQAYAIKR